MQPAPAPGVLTPPPAGVPREVLPPASRARRTAIVLSVFAVLFSLVFGYCIRHAFSMLSVTMDEAVYFRWVAYALGFLVVALLFRMCAAICELLWLERTWSNLPEDLQKVGPVEKVSSGLVIGISFVPGVAWLWKLGLIVGITNGFEALRGRLGFRGPVPKRLGVAAVIIGWIPGLNVYLAPFLWEMFATRMERLIEEIITSRAGLSPAPIAVPLGPQAGAAGPPPPHA